MELFDILTYDFIKAPPSLDVGDVFETVAEVVTPTRVPGVYEYGVAVTWLFDRTNRSAYMQFSIDGGVTWHEFSAEPKDSTDANAFYYAFPVETTTTEPLQLTVQFRKETGAGVLDVSFIDLWVKRIG